jgi:hypothetical protein
MRGAASGDQDIVPEARQALIVASLLRPVQKLSGGREDLEDRDRRSDALGAAELAAVVGQHRADRQIELGVERHDLVGQHRDRGLGLLGDVQEAEGVGTEGVDHDRNDRIRIPWGTVGVT